MNGNIGDVLVFAPEKVLVNVLSHLKMNYHTTDLFSIDVDFPGEDIQSLSFADNSYDWVLCNHVLEHVINDIAAMRECFRVIRPGGKAIFTIPGDYHSEETVIYDKPDGNGHYRFYGRDVCRKFGNAGFQVEMFDMGLNNDKKWGIRVGDIAFICSKTVQ